MRVHKLHGCGNDYLFIDAWQERLPANLRNLARSISDRHRGLGSDGLIVIGPSDVADVRMQMYNADGSRSQMCGNGIRCAGKLAWDHGRIASPVARIETDAGIRTVEGRIDRHGNYHAARVAMGRPRLDPALIPVRVESDARPAVITVELAEQRLELVCVGMGNPHAVCFVDHIAAAPLHSLRPQLERHPLFPERSNIEFVARLGDEDGRPLLRQRTWERGSGVTQACGTGASAVMVAARLTGRIAGDATTVRLDGGDLLIEWDGRGEVFMTGEAVFVCDADWPWPRR